MTEEYKNAIKVLKMADDYIATLKNEFKNLISEKDKLITDLIAENERLNAIVNGDPEPDKKDIVNKINKILDGVEKDYRKQKPSKESYLYYINMQEPVDFYIKNKHRNLITMDEFNFLNTYSVIHPAMEVYLYKDGDSYYAKASDNKENANEYEKNVIDMVQKYIDLVWKDLYVKNLINTYC